MSRNEWRMYYRLNLEISRAQQNLVAKQEFFLRRAKIRIPFAEQYKTELERSHPLTLRQPQPPYMAGNRST